MKKIYEAVELDLVVLTAMDVLTFSKENEKDDLGDDIFTPQN